MFYGVDHATGYIVNYGLHRKYEALAVIKRCVVDMAHKAGTAVKCVRGHCDDLWTSRGFVEFCDSMDVVLRQHGRRTRAVPAWSTAVQRSGRERDSAVQQGRHGITPFGSPPFGARGFFVHQ